LDENKDTNIVEYPNIYLNQLLQIKAKSTFQTLLRWKIYQFPSIGNIPSSYPKTLQYFGLDLVDGELQRTYWMHKPSVWQDLFESVFEIAANGQGEAIHDMFQGILACPVHASPNGCNEVQTFKTAKEQINQHWIMLVPMQAENVSSEYIPEFICQFQCLCKKPYIRSAYKSGIKGISQHHGLMTAISEDGNYWIGINNAVQKDIIYESNICLSEVLMDCTIKEIVSLMIDVKKDPDTWTDSVKIYAFGNQIFAFDMYIVHSEIFI